MIKVKVGVIFTLKEILGGNNHEIELKENSTLNGLLKKLSDCYGEKFKKQLFDPKTGEVKFYRIVLNGRQCTDLETPLNDGDRIDFYPAMAGG
jgi:MoaD family protein